MSRGLGELVNSDIFSSPKKRTCSGPVFVSPVTPLLTEWPEESCIEKGQRIMHGQEIGSANMSNHSSLCPSASTKKGSGLNPLQSTR